MPKDALGRQQITFGVAPDHGEDVQSWRWLNSGVRGYTVRQIAARRGNPSMEREVARKNKIRSVLSILGRRRLLVPALAWSTNYLHVTAGDEPPRIVDGYGKFSVFDRPERVGLTQFDGYNPLTMEVPVLFDRWALDRIGGGMDIERDIATLERLAGRGRGSTPNRDAPAIVRVSSTDNNGQIVSLIPENYQWSGSNKTAPLWRIVGIDWDANPLRHDNGRRMRQAAVVTLQEHTRVQMVTRTAVERAKARAAAKRKADAKAKAKAKKK